MLIIISCCGHNFAESEKSPENGERVAECGGWSIFCDKIVL